VNISPEGAEYNSLWHTPQDSVALFYQALKGRNMYSALSGLEYVCVSVTQGDALGYYIAPLRGLNE
jgi:hypothetical protein